MSPLYSSLAVHDRCLWLREAGLSDAAPASSQSAFRPDWRTTVGAVTQDTGVLSDGFAKVLLKLLIRFIGVRKAVRGIRPDFFLVCCALSLHILSVRDMDGFLLVTYS